MQKIHKHQWQGQQVYQRHRHKYHLAWEGVEGVELTAEGVGGVGLSVGEGVGSWLSSSIFPLASSCMSRVIFCLVLVF